MMKHLRDKAVRVLLYCLFGLSVAALIIQRWSSIAAIALFAVGTVVSIVFFLESRSRHVATVTEYLQALNRGDYSYDLNAYDEGELNVLHSELNKTTVHLQILNQELLKQQSLLKTSLEDISHQLKTPLASLSILNDLDDQESLIVQNSRTQINRMNRLVSSLLKLVQLEAQTLPFNLEKIKGKDFVLELVSEMRPLIDHHQLDVHLELEDVMIVCDPQQTAEAFSNVINNKLRYAKQVIKISLKRSGLSAELKISDDGPMIEYGLRERIFERFFSGPDKSPESVGIGLALSKAIMSQQDGRLYITDTNTFVFRFERMTEV